jgi:hypothetical protein
MDKQSWPAWFYGPDGASMVCESEADVPAGWQDHPSKVDGVTEQAAPAEKTPATEKVRTPLAEARIAYKAKFGRAPSPRATLDDLNTKLTEPQSLDL